MPHVPALKAYGSKQGIEEDKEMEHLSQGPWGRLWDVCGRGQLGWVLAGEL